MVSKKLRKIFGVLSLLGLCASLLPGQGVFGATTTGQAIALNEGMSTQYSIALESAPEGDVVVVMSRNGLGNSGIVELVGGVQQYSSSHSFVFTVDNWNVAQSVEIGVFDDDVDQPGDTYAEVFSFAVSGPVGSVSDAQISDLTIDITDNEVTAVYGAEINLDLSALSILPTRLVSFSDGGPRVVDITGSMQTMTLTPGVWYFEHPQYGAGFTVEANGQIGWGTDLNNFFELSTDAAGNTTLKIIGYTFQIDSSALSPRGRYRVYSTVGATPSLPDVATVTLYPRDYSSVDPTVALFRVNANGSLTWDSLYNGTYEFSGNSLVVKGESVCVTPENATTSYRFVVRHGYGDYGSGEKTFKLLPMMTQGTDWSFSASFGYIQKEGLGLIAANVMLLPRNNDFLLVTQTTVEPTNDLSVVVGGDSFRVRLGTCEELTASNNQNNTDTNGSDTGTGGTNENGGNGNTGGGTNEGGTQNSGEQGGDPAPVAGNGGGISYTPSLRAPVDGFKVLINNGDEKTSSQNVVLSLNGGVDATNMAISNSNDFSAAATLPYQATTTWTMTDGDGIKTVFVKFFNTSNYAWTTVSDAIIFEGAKAPQLVLGEKVNILDTLIAKTKRGERSNTVVELQNELKNQGYFPKNILSTGYFGPVTMASVLKYEATKTAFQNAEAIRKITDLLTKVDVSGRGEDVRNLQNFLKTLGVFPTDVLSTGYFGSITVEAIRAYFLAK